MRYAHHVVGGDSLELEVVRALGIESLHYGLWREGQPLTVDALLAAQENYTAKLIGMVPEGTRTVLDVGSGLGDNAIHMSHRGMSVTCVSPSPSQESHFGVSILPVYNRISFIKDKYEDLEIDSQFDVVLMSESSNYFPIDRGLNQTLRFLKRGGYLIMGALFRRDARAAFGEMHVYGTFLDAAKERGLVLLEDIDVTREVVPTLELAHNVVRYIPALAGVLTDFYSRKFKTKSWIASKLSRAFLGREIELAKEIVFEVLPRRMDPGPFLEHVTYRFLSFRRQ